MAGGTVMLRDMPGLDWLGSPPLLWFEEEGSQQGKGQEGREWQRGQQGNGQARPQWTWLLSPLPSSLRYHPTSTSLSPFLCQHKSGLWQVKESESEESCPVVSDSLQPHGLYNPWNSPGQNTGVGSLSLLQGIFPTQGWNPSLPHCRWIFFTTWATREVQEYWSGSLSLLQWIFPTQESNKGLLHCRQVLYQLGYRGCPGQRWGLNTVAEGESDLLKQ